jgi:hypothetical protein
MKLHFVFICIFLCLGANAKDCTYQVFKWNTVSKKIEGPIRVAKQRSTLSADHFDKNGCSVCEQDQVEIELVNQKRLRVCYRLVDQIKEALNKSILEGFDIKSVKGYLVKMTRGPIDKEGYRTKFSNHSYGTAVDVNREYNGLYNSCENFGPNCRLSLGGKWDPNNPLSIAPHSPIYQNMKEVGFKWGGEIKSYQKDFMHFSLSGF